MNEIMSNQSVAQSVTTRLDSSLQSIREHHINFAEQTTVKGNARAKETIEAEKIIIHEFVSALQQDIARIQTVASEFEVTDQALGDGFK
ncbi:TIGR04197 family type VII secretion effector [Pseudogracilibacillus auburnensis]|uniref:Type VII secretion effector (TIGR04197 family) n=1 Tax=Pseudogracilibacillus auburnensis TaxID=1494959 RepID=A0A2V3VWP8_9BACI|nr:TIGR04197 family type VII secretion effector [Pseudogracilibacillus auburnensis]MBO1002262.1 TIGR04197 family type VII secretion effector [Pseudogracilibacillus auburnensis]PXW86352.1 type VII secretion effector (TIGR04197 family) [Pseudogracilibacillus auburnensis]